MRYAGHSLHYRLVALVIALTLAVQGGCHVPTVASERSGDDVLAIASAEICHGAAGTSDKLPSWPSDGWGCCGYCVCVPLATSSEPAGSAQPAANVAPGDRRMAPILVLRDALSDRTTGPRGPPAQPTATAQSHHKSSSAVVRAKSPDVQSRMRVS